MKKKYIVFVSSTYKDLMDEREKVTKALLQKNCIPVGMEYFNASNKSQWETIQNLIKECDYFVLIIAGRYGSIEPSSGLSYTQKEFEYANELNIPVISFLHGNPGGLPCDSCESSPSNKKKLNSFKKEVKKKLCKSWDNSDNLATQVILSLDALIQEEPRDGWVRADMNTSNKIFEGVNFIKKAVINHNSLNAPLLIRSATKHIVFHASFYPKYAEDGDYSNAITSAMDSNKDLKLYVIITSPEACWFSELGISLRMEHDNIDLYRQKIITSEMFFKALEKRYNDRVFICLSDFLPFFPMIIIDDIILKGDYSHSEIIPPASLWLKLESSAVSIRFEENMSIRKKNAIYSDEDLSIVRYVDEATTVLKKMGCKSFSNN